MSGFFYGVQPDNDTLHAKNKHHTTHAHANTSLQNNYHLARFGWWRRVGLGGLAAAYSQKAYLKWHALWYVCCVM